jgi:hypothetical protein
MPVHVVEGGEVAELDELDELLGCWAGDSLCGGLPKR